MKLKTLLLTLLLSLILNASIVQANWNNWNTNSSTSTSETKSNLDFSNDVPKEILNSLSPGIFYMGLWSRHARYDWTEQHSRKIMTNSDLEFVDNIGFKSIRLMFSLEPLFFPECIYESDRGPARECAEEDLKYGRAKDIIQNKGLASEQISEERYQQLLSQIKRTINNSNQYVVIVPSGRQRNKNKNGKPWGEATTIVSYSMIESEDMVQAFTAFWKRLANDLTDISPKRLGFELYNEPEFCYEGTKVFYPQRWNNIATSLTDEIRKISPDHTIFVSGVCKGTAFRTKKDSSNFKYPINNLGIPIDRKNIVYVFHAYPDEPYANQRYNNLYADVVYGVDIPASKYIKPDKAVNWKIERGVERIANWRKNNQVPIWLNEFGVRVPYKGYKYFNEAIKDRTNLASKVVESLKKYQVPYSWSKFGLDRRIFLNDTKIYGVDHKRNPDCDLLKALDVGCGPSYMASDP